MLNPQKIDSIVKICIKYKINNFIINTDGSIDVVGDVNLKKMGLSEFPVKFNKITGFFDCSGNRLTTLKRGPVEVGGYFHCDYNKLKSLIYGPVIVGDSFNCSNNYLNSLKYVPRVIPGMFTCSANNLNSFRHLPDFVGCLYATNNRIKTLEYLSGCVVKYEININGNHLESLVGAPTDVNGDFRCHANRLASLKGIPQNINGSLDFGGNKLTTIDHFPGVITGRLIWTGNDFSRSLDNVLKSIRSNKLKIFCKYFNYYDVFDPSLNSDNFDILMAEIEEGLE